MGAVGKVIGVDHGLEEFLCVSGVFKHPGGTDQLAAQACGCFLALYFIIGFAVGCRPVSVKP